MAQVAQRSSVVCPLNLAGSAATARPVGDAPCNRSGTSYSAGTADIDVASVAGGDDEVGPAPVSAGLAAGSVVTVCAAPVVVTPLYWRPPEPPQPATRTPMTTNPTIRCFIVISRLLEARTLHPPPERIGLNTNLT